MIHVCLTLVRDLRFTKSEKFSKFIPPSVKKEKPMCPMSLCVSQKKSLCSLCETNKKAMTTNSRHRQITPSIMKNQTNLVQRASYRVRRRHRDCHNAH